MKNTLIAANVELPGNDLVAELQSKGSIILPGLFGWLAEDWDSAP